MNQLDEIWQNDFDQAVRQAETEKRSDIAEYFSLRSINDRVRRESVKWLFETVLEIAAAFNAHNANIEIVQKENHRFKGEKADLTGSLLKLQRGVRCLTFEAGWTQHANDGFMRGGALVFSRISHFGFPKKTEELVLLKFEDQPQWFVVDGETKRTSFDISRLRPHFEILLG